MERKIGEIFEYNGEWYQCVKDDMYDYCKGCASFENLRCVTLYGNRDCWLKATCKKLEKVGEPITYMNRTYQRLKSLDDNTCKYCYFKNQVCNPQLCGEAFFLVGIKKVVEDMGEENDIKPYDKYFSNGTVSNTDNLPKSTLKPFDLQQAKDGKPVCTRDGRKARIICFDAKGTHPIIALVSDPDIEGEEIPFCYTNDGFYNNPNCESTHDLMILPEKHEGWVNLYRDFNVVHAKNVFDTKQEALKNISNGENCIATVKIVWEE